MSDLRPLVCISLVLDCMYEAVPQAVIFTIYKLTLHRLQASPTYVCTPSTGRTPPPPFVTPTLMAAPLRILYKSPQGVDVAARSSTPNGCAGRGTRSAFALRLASPELVRAVKAIPPPPFSHRLSSLSHAISLLSGVCLDFWTSTLGPQFQVPVRCESPRKTPPPQPYPLSLFVISLRQTPHGELLSSAAARAGRPARPRGGRARATSSAASQFARPVLQMANKLPALGTRSSPPRHDVPLQQESRRAAPRTEDGVLRRPSRSACATPSPWAPCRRAVARWPRSKEPAAARNNAAPAAR